MELGMMRFSHLVARLAAIAGAWLAFSEAKAAAATCDFTGTTVYVAGANAAGPYLETLSGVLASQTPPVNLVYFSLPSCEAVTDFTTPTAVTSSATYWTVSGGVTTANTCTPSTPVSFDASVSDVYASTCLVTTFLAGQQEFAGPVQAMTFAVNPGSNQTAISEEAAHVVFEDIGVTSYTVSPWTVPSQLFIRSGGNTGAGVRFMIGSALGFKDDNDWSVDIPTANVLTSQTTLLSDLAAATANANETLGTLSSTVTDLNRVGSTSTTQVKVLAFQGHGQTCGYFPDSSPSAFDKRNVREGRYLIWGPLHFITAVSGGVPVSSSDSGNAAANAAVKSLIELVTLDPSLTDSEAEQSIAAAAEADVVSDCAMRVQRAGEVTVNPVEYSYAPPEGSCGCYWESKTSTAAPAGCTTCTTSTTCPSTNPVCRYGYCEAF
jgi:hypothetical protein